MKLFPYIIPYKLSSPISINKFPHLYIYTHQSVHNIASTQPHSEDSAITTVCNFLKTGPNWKTLNRKLSSINLNNSLIEKVLVQLKEPPDAKPALNFFHWSSHVKNTKHEIYLYSLTIHILVRAKLIKDALALLESVLTISVCRNSGILLVVDSLIDSYEITSSSPFVFDLLIQTCSKLRMINDAIDMCWYLGKCGFRLSVISYNTLLHVVKKSDQTCLVWRVYEHMIEKRIYPNEVTVRIMVSALCKEGKLKKVVDMIDRIHGKRCSAGVIVNTCLVWGMIEEGRVDDGLVLLKRMLQKNMILDTISYSLIVYAKVKMGNLESAWEVYEDMLKRGFNANSFVHTSFIGAYCEVGRIVEANGLIREMENVGLKAYDETFIHLIVGFSKVGRLEESLKICEKMVESGFVPSCLAFNEMAERLCQNGGTERANEMLTLLLEKGFVPDENTYSHLIAGYGRQGDVEGVLKLYYEMEYKSLSPGALVFTWLIISLCQSGRLEEAEKYLKVMKTRSLVPSKYIYETLISSHSKKDGNITAQHLNIEMIGEGFTISGNVRE